MHETIVESILGAYIHGVSIFVFRMGAYIRKELVRTEVGACIHGMPIIPILRYLLQKRAVTCIVRTVYIRDSAIQSSCDSASLEIVEFCCMPLKIQRQLVCPVLGMPNELASNFTSAC